MLQAPKYELSHSDDLLEPHQSKRNDATVMGAIGSGVPAQVRQQVKYAALYRIASRPAIGL